MSRSRLSLSLVLSLFCAQLLFAWHSPSHIDPTTSPHEQALLVADCDLCAHGHGFVALPAAGMPELPASSAVLGQAKPQPFHPPFFALPQQARAPPHYA